MRSHLEAVQCDCTPFIPTSRAWGFHLYACPPQKPAVSPFNFTLILTTCFPSMSESPWTRFPFSGPWKGVVFMKSLSVDLGLTTLPKTLWPSSVGLHPHRQFPPLLYQALPSSTGTHCCPLALPSLYTGGKWGAGRVGTWSWQLSKMLAWL